MCCVRENSAEISDWSFSCLLAGCRFRCGAIAVGSTKPIRWLYLRRSIWTLSSLRLSFSFSPFHIFKTVNRESFFQINKYMQHHNHDFLSTMPRVQSYFGIVTFHFNIFFNVCMFSRWPFVVCLCELFFLFFNWQSRNNFPLWKFPWNRSLID